MRSGLKSLRCNAWFSSLLLSAFFTLQVTSNSSLFAANVATQTVTFSVNQISEIAISSNPPPLVAVMASAGSNPLPVVDSSTFFAITTNGVSEKVVVSMNSSMPIGTSLFLEGSAPNGAVSVGDVSLDVTDQNLVTGISQTAQSNLFLKYTFVPTAAAGSFPATSRVVIFTLTP